MRRSLIAIIILPIFSCAISVSAPATQPSTKPVKEIKIDLDRAVQLPLPEKLTDLKPANFKTTDGKQGWAIRIPGSRPIATPAFANIDGRGMLFVGGGYGSHEFYAFDAATGEKIWETKTADDGPSAAVVEDSYVAFNTESCTVIVTDARTGKTVWQEWLGDPLMSQPAISKGKLYIAYPAGQGKHVNQAAAAQAPQAPAKTSHKLLCADLKTGNHIWEQDITGDVISAPIIDGDQIFFTCFNGTSFCLAAKDGAVAWQKENAGTSAPVVALGQVVMTQKETRNGESYEGLRRLESAKGQEKDLKPLAQARANYLKKGASGNGGLATTQAVALDSAVGFASAPDAAGLTVGGADHLNVGTVAQAWAFQGSRAAYANGRILNAQANVFNCVSATDGSINWRGTAAGKEVAAGAQIFAPPSLGAKNMYLCGATGHLLSMRQEDGQVNFLYKTTEPMAFQPALANGNIYAGTNSGLLICLKTGDNDADGWTAWGGNAQHNKTEMKQK